MTNNQYLSNCVIGIAHEFYMVAFGGVAVATLLVRNSFAPYWVQVGTHLPKQAYF